MANNESIISYADEILPPTWSARIVNLSQLKIQKSQTAADRSGLGIFYLVIYYSGWQAYWFVFNSSVLFMVLLLLNEKLRRIESGSTLYILFITFLMLSSISTAGIIITIVVNFGNLWWGAYPLLMVYLGILIFLVWPLAVKFFYMKTRNIMK